jgi:hypothetical protein
VHIVGHFFYIYCVVRSDIKKMDWSWADSTRIAQGRDSTCIAQARNFTYILQRRDGTYVPQNRDQLY